MDEPLVQNDASVAPVSDGKPKFRTYASDVAKLTGKPFVGTPTNTPAPKKVAPTPATVTSTAPVSPPAPISVPAPAPVPFDPPPAQIIPKAPSTEESRETVLARLKSKVAGRPVPVEEVPQKAASAPSTNETREQVLKRLQAKAARPPQPLDLQTPPGLPELSKQTTVTAPAGIHTYKSDFSEKAKAENASPITVLAAEANAQGRTSVPVTLRAPRKNYLPYIAGAVALILAGGGSLYFAVSFVTGRPPVIIVPSIPSLVFADVQVELRGNGAELQQGLSDLRNENLNEGGVAVAYLTYASTTAKGEPLIIPAAGGVLISALGLDAPEILLRNVELESTVGVVRANNATHPFFIFRVASYERTFAGMLAWEKSMELDLSRFYPAYPEEEVTLGTSTSASTTPTEAPFVPVFVDSVIENQDVRILRDREGRALMLYGYKDKETLILVRDEKAFSELLARLASQRSQ